MVGQQSEADVTTLQPPVKSWWTSLGWCIAACGLAAGWFMPEFYDWTGADQSKPARVVGWIAIALLVANLLLCIALIWDFCRSKKGSHAARTRFSLMHLIVATATVALLISASQLSWVTLFFGVLNIAVLIATIAIAFRFPSARFGIVLMLLTTMLPYAWLLRQPIWLVRQPLEPSLDIRAIASIVGLPSFVPAALITTSFFRTPEDHFWLAGLLSSLELCLGVWLAFLGSRRAVAYCAILATLSLMGSFILQAMIRA